MKLDYLTTIKHFRRITSIILSTTGFIISLIILPITKVLPEETGLPIFVIFLPYMFFSAMLGVLLRVPDLKANATIYNRIGVIGGIITLIIASMVILAPPFLSL